MVSLLADEFCSKGFHEQQFHCLLVCLCHVCEKLHIELRENVKRLEKSIACTLLVSECQILVQLLLSSSSISSESTLMDNASDL